MLFTLIIILLLMNTAGVIYLSVRVSFNHRLYKKTFYGKIEAIKRVLITHDFKIKKLEHGKEDKKMVG